MTTPLPAGNANRYHNPHISRIVNMEPDHILQSLPGSSSSCPVALAMTGDGYRDVSVGLDNSSMSGQVFRIGPRLASWIQSYEEGWAERQRRPEQVPDGNIPLLVDAAQETVDIYLEELCIAWEGT